MPPPTARQLQVEARERELRRRVAFLELETRMFNRIRLKAGAGWQRLVHSVPAYVIGLPRYDVRDAAEYLSGALREAGYLAEVFGGSVLYVSWDRREAKERGAAASAAAAPRDRERDREAAQASARRLLTPSGGGGAPRADPLCLRDLATAQRA